MAYEDVTDEKIDDIVLAYSGDDSILYVEDERNGQMGITDSFWEDRYSVKKRVSYRPEPQVIETFQNEEEAKKFTEEIVEQL